MIDSMANAIVASSLASSRAVSPTRPNPPQPPPPRRHLFHNHHSKEPSRTPSPAKPQGLKTTLRKAKPDDEVEENEKRRHRRGLVKKHPNKHHEGDRKRWRDAITERERKRYEAVWASNKGLFPSPELKPEVSAPSVCNLVVRDIYSRSRLNDDVLEEVYNLVDRHVNGRLQKEEFVVGLWLIDQRLKGRKLPPRVSESVWRSAGLLGDIKVKGAKGSRHR
ncbi:hypothetical protein F5884DRAFT_807117 [Xylogone sp. PMI_703]|nr:hypothetical protein F5884DRAFT_807117 [Xylogone sp. PMI_703]